MPKVTYIAANGDAQEVEATNGSSAMRTALMNGVKGIAADCGGETSCATCHVYVADEWLDNVGTPGLDEDDMLEFTECERRENSRLSCHISIDDDLDGLVLHLPEAQ